MAKVFIGMPVYNGEDHLANAIESFLNQSFTDFTIFISDNASTDSTSAIAQKYAAQDSRVIYYRQPENLGMFGNFKFVLYQSDAEYFLWAAHDDVRDKEYLKVCVEALDADKELGLAATATQLVDVLGRPIAEVRTTHLFSDRSILMQVIRYTLQTEGFGKVNVIYGVWRTEAARIVWEAYPQRAAWGQDNHVVLALVGRYRIHVDERLLFKKIPTLHRGQTMPAPGPKPKLLSRRDQSNPFPYKHFRKYFAGHMEALRGTPYRPLVALLLYMRLPHSFWVYARERNYKKFFRRLMSFS